MLDNDTRIAIGELLREEKNRNADMMYDLMLYGHLVDENGRQLTGMQNAEPPKTNEMPQPSEPMKKSIEIDLTKEKPEIREIKTNIRTKETNVEKVKGCPRMACRHNYKGHCTSDVVLKWHKQCDTTNGFTYFEEREKK